MSGFVRQARLAGARLARLTSPPYLVLVREGAVSWAIRDSNFTRSKPPTSSKTAARVMEADFTRHLVAYIGTNASHIASFTLLLCVGIPTFGLCSISCMSRSWFLSGNIFEVGVSELGVPFITAVNYLPTNCFVISSICVPAAHKPMSHLCRHHQIVSSHLLVFQCGQLPMPFEYHARMLTLYDNGGSILTQFDEPKGSVRAPWVGYHLFLSQVFRERLIPINKPTEV